MLYAIKEKIKGLRFTNDTCKLSNVQDLVCWSAEDISDLLPNLKCETCHMLAVGNDYEDFGNISRPSEKEEFESIKIDLVIKKIEDNQYQVKVNVSAEWEGKKDSTSFTIEDYYEEVELVSGDFLNYLFDK